MQIPWLGWGEASDQLFVRCFTWIPFILQVYKNGKLYLVAPRAIIESSQEWMQIKMNSVHVTTENIM